MEKRLTLFELNTNIKNAISTAIPNQVWVMAEISELKENRNGHCYIELIEKQDQEIIARARANIWSYTYRILKPYFETTTGQAFTCDIKVLVKATVEFHPTYGLSLNIKDIDPAYTIGDMLLHRREIIERLHKEGVFDMNKELDLPLVPQNIAVISSGTAAGYQDFINQLDMNVRGFKFYTRLFKAYMQGTHAAPSIISALENIYKYENLFDVVVIIRGGGATADLSSFDNYNLAFHITQFPLPVITGIGHEKDDTIIDLVAHTRLKTPTAVAEFLITGAESFYDNLIQLEEEIVEITRQSIDNKKEKLDDLATEIQSLVAGFVDLKSKQLSKTGNLFQQQVNLYSFRRKYELNKLGHMLQSLLSVWKVQHLNKLNLAAESIERKTREAIQKAHTELKQTTEQCKHLITGKLNKEQERINTNENNIRLLNPQNVINRGYTLT